MFYSHLRQRQRCLMLHAHFHDVTDSVGRSVKPNLGKSPGARNTRFAC